MKAPDKHDEALSGWTPSCTGLVGLLLIALGLRLILVFHGGEHFWADEGRYDAATEAWRKWAEGHFREGWLLIIGSADHLGFKLMMLGPAWLQTHWHDDFRIPGVTLSLFSTANIHWVWRIARRAGAGEREAFWGALTMAGANSMFYWSRHAVPYDLSLFWALACLYVTLNPAGRILDSLLAGFLGFMAFVTYNGYWAIIACVLTGHVLLAVGAWRRFFLRTFFGLLGLVTPYVLLILGAGALQIDLLDSYVNFAGTISQGDFNEGYVVFFDYLWRAEGFTVVIWALALALTPWYVRRTEGEARRRGLLWAGTIVALAAILIMGSNVFGIFVVYGRLARQVAPFCALLVGWMAGQVFRENRGGGRLELLAMAGLVACGLWAEWTPLWQDFPVPFHRRAVGVVNAYRTEHLKSDPELVAPQKFRFLYNGFIWPMPDEAPLPPNYLVLLASPHPLSWRPYLYEGFNRAQRDKILATDVTMRVVLLKD